MLCGWHIKIWNLTNHMKKNETKNIRLIVFSFSSVYLAFWCFCFAFSCGLQDFKYVNCKAFGAIVLYWVDFNIVMHYKQESHYNGNITKWNKHFCRYKYINSFIIMMEYIASLCIRWCKWKHRSRMEWNKSEWNWPLVVKEYDFN